MVGPLVDTKRRVPPPRPGQVDRPRLARPPEARLTLVRAPAGSGTTTLLAGWAAAADRPVVWLSLEESDRRPAAFWTSLVLALRTVVPAVGAGARRVLLTPRAPIETVLTTVLAELARRAGRLDLVLDDYHLADGPELWPGMAFLVEHLPPQVHLVIGAHTEPGLPLDRLRARGELVELGADDLRFTRAEAAAYRPDLAGPDLDALLARTEGRAAALHWATRAGDAATGDAATGDVDSLIGAVLDRQPAGVRDFLLRTSVLDRLTGPLADAVTGRTGGAAALEQAGEFVLPLDDRHEWYRWPDLVAGALRARLAAERPDEIAALHRRAGDWYEGAGEPARAIRHALAAGAVDHAAELVERAVPELRRTRQEATIRAWLEDVPHEVVRRRPVLAVGYLGALVSDGEFEDVEGRLWDVERCLERTPGDVVVLDPAELDRLPGAIERYRAALALSRGNVPATIDHAQRAIDRAATDDHLTRATAAGLAGLAHWDTGDLDAAHRAYSACVDGLTRAGHLTDVLGCSVTLADIRGAQGRLGDARRTYEGALRLAGTHLRGTADLYVGLSQVACERGDQPTARRHLATALELGGHLGLPQNPYRWRLAMARVREADGDLAGAVALLEEAQQVYVGDFAPDVRPVAAVRARLLAAQGRTGEALGWVRAQRLNAGDVLTYRREFEHVTVARVLLARYREEPSGPLLRTTARFLARLLAAAEEGRRAGSVIEILVLQALARHAGRDLTGAVASLTRALTLAEPEGYVRVLAGEGAPMTSLLRRVETHPYARRLLDAVAVPAG